MLQATSDIFEVYSLTAIASTYTHETLVTACGSTVVVSVTVHSLRWRIQLTHEWQKM